MPAFPPLKNDLEEGKEGCKGAVAFFSTDHKLQERMDGLYSTTLAGELHNKSLDVEMSRRGCIHRPCNHKAGYKTKNRAQRKLWSLALIAPLHFLGYLSV